MSLTQEQIGRIEAVIKESIRRKFQNYKPETKNMPFHYRLLGKDRMALFSGNVSDLFILKYLFSLEASKTQRTAY